MAGTMLDSIIDRKKAEVEALKRSGVEQNQHGSSARSFIAELEKADHLAIISEFKRASPSKGNINLDANPKEQALLYSEAGAAAISVLTDEKGFKGSFSDLVMVREAVGLPVLCKDFIIDEVQIDLARNSGADVILLIAAALDLQMLSHLHAYAAAKGMECLVEIHDEADLQKALAIKAPLIGINNRDLRTFSVNLHTTERLGPLVRNSGALLISESGMKTKEDAERAAAAGANGILVGETLMKAAKISDCLMEFKIPLGGKIFEG